MRSTILALILTFAVVATASAQPIVRGATPEESAAAAGAARFGAREALKRALFGVGKLPKGCSWELVDPSQEYVATNLAINCGGELLTACDAQGYSCD